jgi:hypothetical protein
VFSAVRGVLLRPLVNRDEDCLIYIRQSAPGLGIENSTFSMPEITDLKSRVTTIAAFGDFSTVVLALLGLGGEPRMVKAGVVNGSYFEVMGLRPVLERLLNTQDDGPYAAGAAVLYRFGRPPSTATRPWSVRRFASASAPRRSVASSSRRCPLRPRRRSSRTSSPPPSSRGHDDHQPHPSDDRPLRAARLGASIPSAAKASSPCAPHWAPAAVHSGAPSAAAAILLAAAVAASWMPAARAARIDVLEALRSE